MIKSLRYRLLAWFLFVIFVIAGTVIPLILLRERNETSLQQINNDVNALQIQFLKDFKTADKFLAHEINNTHFFITGESEYITQHERLKKDLSEGLNNLPEGNTARYSDLEKYLGSIRSDFNSYCNIFDSIIYSTYRRGYRDLGLLGELNSLAYLIDNRYHFSSSEWDVVRNLEREYLYRKDTSVQDNIQQKCNVIINQIGKNRFYSTGKKEELTNVISKYSRCFNELIALDQYIGINNNSGLIKRLNTRAYSLEYSLQELIVSAKTTNTQIKTRSNIVFGIVALLLCFVSIILSIYLSKHILTRLNDLTRYISNLTKLNFRYNQSLDLRNSSVEIRHIYKEFRNMVAQLIIREKQRDNALIQAEENQKRYQDLTDMLPQSVYETDALGNITYANNAWFKAFGYTKQDIEDGLNLIEILNSKASQELFGEDKIENSEYTAIRKDGSFFPASVYSSTIKNGDKIIARRGIIIDVTLRNKYIESLRNETIKAQTSDKHKSSFLANMSHEIRTPMNTIIGFANLLSSKEVPDEQKIEFIKYIQSSGELLLNLIDDIIDVAKIEAGEIKIHKTSCHVNIMLKELHKGFKEIKKKYDRDNINLFLEIPKESIVFKSDPFRLKQIMSNLISNAIKFTEEGKVTYGVHIKNNELEFFIEDTGIGITPEELQIIFERFKRTVLTEHKKISGTGLGLAISKNLVEMLGGKMWVDSKLNKGTRFWFTLPYIKTETKNTISQLPETEMIEPLWENKTFLIVEDDRNNYLFLKESLKKTKAQTIWVKDGEEAIKYCKNNRNLDLVLMDIQLPTINGYEATKIIKKEQPNLPVIAQTAFAMEGDKEKSVLAGCNDYITKPIDIYSLYAKIEQFIDTNETSIQIIEEPDQEIITETKQEILNKNFTLKDKN